MSNERPETRRLFFALWPDEATRERMAALLATLRDTRGRAVKAEKLHVTLAFIGNADADYHQCLASAAQEVQAARFEFELARLGYFKRPRVLWLGTDGTPEPLLDLVGQLNRRLKACGYRPESRPFQAHITLMRKAHAAPQGIAFEPIRWRAEDFCLVESVPEQGGVHYDVLRRYPLR